MSNLDQVWSSTQADGEFAENNPAPAGVSGVIRISGYRTGKSKKGELYYAVDVVDDAQGYNWGVYKQFTKNGQPHEGSIKSAKITLRQLGLDVQSPAQLDAALAPLVGRYFTYERVASDRANAAGEPFVNTDITGAASPPAQAAPPASTAVQAPTQVQTPNGTATFPAAVPAQAPAAVVPAQIPAATMGMATPDPWPNTNTQTAPAVPQGVPVQQQVVQADPTMAAQQMQQAVQAQQAAQVPGQVDPHPFN